MLFRSEQNYMSETDIVALVDSRLDVIERRRTKEKLGALLSQFELASESSKDNRMIYGKLDARITLQEFADIECPFCRKMHGSMKQIVDHSKGVINWEFKHFPLESHNPAAAIESRAVECAYESYDNRTAWVTLDQLIQGTRGNGKGVADLQNYLRSFGVNGSMIDFCIRSISELDKVAEDYSNGKMAGVSATPTVRIIDNQTGQSLLLRGYQKPEQILNAIQKILSHG